LQQQQQQQKSTSLIGRTRGYWNIYR